METVILGQDKSITSQPASDSSEDSGAQSYADAVPSLSQPEGRVYATCTLLCTTTGVAEVWQNLEVIGHYPANVQIDVSGFWKAGISDVGAGAGAQAEAFIRDSSGEIDSEFALNKISDVVEFWEDESVYTESLSWSGRLDPGMYEVGLRVTGTANAIGEEAARTDLHRNRGNVVPGFGRLDAIKIDFVEEVNPFFDGPDLNNPKDRNAVINLIDYWNQSTGNKIDGIEYSEDEVDDLINQWNFISSDDKILFYRPLPGFTMGLPPKNTGEIDDTLYEDISGDGDGLNPGQSVDWWAELITNPDEFNYLTREQVEVLDWQNDGALTPDDAVALWSEQVKANDSLNIRINEKSVEEASMAEMRETVERLSSGETSLEELNSPVNSSAEPTEKNGSK